MVDRRGWISREDFIDLLAITQTAPGPLAVNTSIYVGYVLRGITGALVSAGGCILPSIVAILVVAALFTQISSLHLIHAAFRGIRPAVVILIVSAALRIGKVSVRSLPQFGIAAAAAILVAFFRVSPALVIVIAALAGLVNDGGGKT
ncbi:MAG: chromate transporter [Firmicutes bacterium]|nr:chromate transporter [Bacillota bacterium]